MIQEDASCWLLVCEIEGVDSRLWGRGCSIFCLERSGEAVLIRKTAVEETQLRIHSLQTARFS